MAPVTRYPRVSGQPALNPGILADSLAAAGQDAPFVGLANSIRCPVGMLPGSAWFVVTRAVYDGLAKNDFHSLSWVHENGTTTWQKYAIFRAVKLGLDGDNTAPYCLEFRDKRQVLRLSAIDREYNVPRRSRGGETGTTDLYYTDTRNGGSDWTWQTMFDDVWGNLPSAIRGTAPTLPYIPTIEPQGFKFHGSAWDAVGTILEALQCVLTLDPINDTLAVQRIGATQSGLQTALAALNTAGRRIRTDGRATDLHLPHAPHTVRFYFPKRPQLESQLAEINTGGPLVDPYHTIDKATGITGAQAGTVLPYRTSYVAELDLDGSTINNASALDSLADDLLAKIKDRLDLGTERRGEFYQGIVTTVAPGSEIREVIWRDYGDGEGCVTELLGDAWHGSVVDQGLIALQHFRGFWLVKPDANIASSASGTCSIWTGTAGSETDSTFNLTAYNRTGLQADLDQFAMAFEMNGQIYLVPWFCPA
jgi:hypothetical protein